MEWASPLLCRDATTGLIVSAKRSSFRLASPLRAFSERALLFSLRRWRRVTLHSNFFYYSVR